MKRIITPFILISLLLFSGCSMSVAPKEMDMPVEPNIVKSIWITYYELDEIVSNKTSSQFKKDFSNIVDNLIEYGFNTITVQVRPFADSFYESNYFPKSKYDKADFDVLSLACDICESKSINIEAWINPYRVSNESSFKSLPKSSPALKWKNTNNLIVDDTGIYFNPASKDVNDLITNGVKEIVDNYNISAIHFDDYFYPSKSKDIDKKDYENYKNNGGELSLNDWRRQNVNSMIKGVRDAIKSSNKNVKFGISPAANINNDKNDLFADVELWCKNNDYIDYICPQVYYGFKNETMPFMSTVKCWLEMSNIDTYIGLPLYKSGEKDEYAGVGKDEFKKDKNVLNRQIEYLSKIKCVKGIYVFSYSSFVENRDEISKLKEI